MIHTGFTIHSPITQSRTTLVESTARSWLLEVYCQPNNASDIREHLHLTWTEHFEIVSGVAHYKLNGVQQTAQAGDSFTVLPGQRHVHPWAAGDTVLFYRQQSDFGRDNPDAIQDVLGTFATIAGLAHEGKIDSEGRPKNPFQLAATIQTLARYGSYDASAPIGVQNMVAATLGRLAAVLGYRSIDERFVGGKN